MTLPGTQRGAILLSLGAFTCWVAADTLLKVAGGSALPGYEMIGLAGAAEVLVLLVNGLRRNDVRGLWPERWVAPALRTLFDIVNNLFVVVALRHLPLELFYVLIFLAPIVTALLAAGLLGERLDWRRGLALATGFLGVVVAVNPLGVARGGDRTGYWACLVCVACFSLNIIASRVMARTESAESLTFVSGLGSMVFGLAGMVWFAAPVPLPVGCLLAGVGAFWTLGSWWFFKALQQTTTATVAQYHYSQLLTGAVVGYLAWRERPTWAMVAGAVLIVGSGWYAAALGEAGGAGEDGGEPDVG